jgi:hypothetical protein
LIQSLELDSPVKGIGLLAFCLLYEDSSNHVSKSQPVSFEGQEKLVEVEAAGLGQRVSVVQTAFQPLSGYPPTSEVADISILTIITARQPSTDLGVYGLT